MVTIEQWCIKQGRRVYRRFFNGTGSKVADYGRAIVSPQDGNDLIGCKIKEGRPLLVARLGSTELSCLANYIQMQIIKGSSRWSSFLKQVGGFDKEWSSSVRHNISFYSGFFPTTDDMLERFCKMYLEDLQLVDVMGIWYNAFEDYVCRNYSQQATFANLTSIEPYYHQNPWSGYLKDKTVLVVHPFAATIEKQLRHRNRLFKNSDVMPDFKVIPIPAVQTIAGNSSPFKTWFDALDCMTENIRRHSFDVAIIGAGAYGLPLGAAVKRLGKQAIHMGGATQILFGIKGKRWDNDARISSLYNEYWTRPGEDEKPARAEGVEGGCYW